MRTKKCAHCKAEIPARQTYCEDCKELIRSGELEVPKEMRYYYRYPDRQRDRMAKINANLPEEEKQRRTRYNTEYVREMRRQRREGR